MSITEVVNMVTAFVVATGPIAITLAILGHALVASPWPKVQRIGKILEGIGWDLKRVSEAFKKGEPPKPQDPPDDPPGGDQTPVAAKPIPVVLPRGPGLSMLALAFVLTGCGMFGSGEPVESCDAKAAAVAKVRCDAYALEKCGEFEDDPSACPDTDDVDAHCERVAREELAECN